MKKQGKFLVAGCFLLVGGLAVAQAQTSKSKPPVAQAWIDVATFSGMGMSGTPGMPGGGMGSMGALGGMFGGAGLGRNEFGRTVSGSSGSWMDVTLFTRNNPKLVDGLQLVPAGTRLAPELRLLSPKTQKTASYDDDEQVARDDNFEPPKGKLYLYWGCGEAVRKGQPLVLDVAKMNLADLRNFFAGRRATQRGAHLAVGRPVWPNEKDSRLLPSGASLLGEHAFKGQGVPEGFKFNIGSNQEIMPPVELGQQERNGTTVLQWKVLPTARAYFISAMGGRGENEMVLWSSSEVQESGFGLIDYQTNTAVDRWLKEKVLLPPEASTCTVPKGIFSEAAMLRMIAYGSELNLSHPPRPADQKQAWDPQWSVKVRVKSVINDLLGAGGATGATGRHNQEQQSSQPPPERTEKQPGAFEGIGQGLDKLKGVFGF